MAFIVGGWSSSEFSFVGEDDSGCTYTVKGKGAGGIGQLALGKINTSYTFMEKEGPCEWPIKLNDSVTSTAIGVGGSMGPKLSLTVSCGFAGRFAESGGVNAEGGVNVHFGFHIATKVEEIAYKITAPAN